MTARAGARPWRWLVVVALLCLVLSAARLAVPREPDGPRAGSSVEVSPRGPLLPSGVVHFIAIDRSGTVWIRLAGAPGQPDRVATIDSNGRRRSYPSLRAVVEVNRSTILSQGTLPDFWGVDPSGNIWIGPVYFDGGKWVDVVGSGGGFGGSIVYEDRAVIDADGKAWVPYRMQGDCGMGGTCESAGLAAFNTRTEMVSEIVIDVISELSRLDLPQVRFLRLANGSMMAMAAKAAYQLPSTTPNLYPSLDADPTTGKRIRGFASTAALRPGGDAAAFTWVEPIVVDPTAAVAEVTGTPAAWQTTDLGASPLFDEGAQGRIITAAAYAPDGTLWVASSDAELAARESGGWTEHFTAENSPLGDPIRALAVDARGAVWIGTARGVRVYDHGKWYTSDTLHMPALELSCGWLQPCGSR